TGNGKDSRWMFPVFRAILAPGRRDRMAIWSKGPLLAALLLAGRPALADCPPAVQARSAEDVAGRIDGYWAAQRQPGTYRALAGLGDPGRTPNDQNERYWNAT